VRVSNVRVALVAMLTAVVAGAGAGAGGVAAANASTEGGAPPAAAPAPPAGAPAPPAAVSPGPFGGTGMWIWELSRSSGGRAQAIVAKAKANGVSTVFVKSSDGSSAWGQFSPALIAALKGGGLRVCAWQYVYGRHPTTEAALGVRAARLGADCLVIDAEMEYEGRYAAAQRYVRALRRGVGARYPVALAGFPYVDYHPAFPYSVFLGPGGAQFNAPQMYWKDIGVSVDQVYRHTYLDNAVYGRAVVPLGQLYSSPRSADIRRFRVLAGAYGAPGLSWWDWQEAPTYAFQAISQEPVAPTALVARPGPPPLHRGARGDLVVWAQQHLRGAGISSAVDGFYGVRTTHAVAVFQRTRALSPTGRLDASTWAALLGAPTARVDWTAPAGARRRSAVRPASATGSAGSAPASATLPPVRNEIRPKRHRRG